MLYPRCMTNLINIGMSKIKDMNQNGNQDYIFQLNKGLKEFEASIFKKSNKYIKAMSLKCQELGFEVEDLKPKNSTSEFGTSLENELVKQMRKNHFDKIRWQRIKLLKDKFNKFHDKSHQRRNAICMDPDTSFAHLRIDVSSPRKDNRSLHIKENKSGNKKDIKLPSILSQEGFGTFSLTATNVLDDLNQSPKSKDVTFSPKRAKFRLESSYGLTGIDIERRKDISKFKKNKSLIIRKDDKIKLNKLVGKYSS